MMDVGVLNGNDADIDEVAPSESGNELDIENESDEVSAPETGTCLNYECTNTEDLIKPRASMLAYFGQKYVKGKRYRICHSCSRKATEHFAELANKLMNHESLYTAEFPVNNETVFLDEEENGDSDEEGPLPEHVAKFIVDDLWPVFQSSVLKYDVDWQLSQGADILLEKATQLEESTKDITASIDGLQDDIDAVRKLFYDYFPISVKEEPPIEIVDIENGNNSLATWRAFTTRQGQPDPCRSPRKNCIVGVATKKVTPLQRILPKPSKPELQVQEVVALETVMIEHKPLPPVGSLQRPRLMPGDLVYVMKHGFHGVWTQARVVELVQKVEENGPQMFYKIRYEFRKTIHQKVVPGKHLAYFKPSPVRLPVGTRVIALFQDEGTKESFYAGVTAEPPKSMNKYRYLVFFDDGYAQYVPHEKVLVVCEQSRSVWDDIHPDSKAFVHNYIDQYPERPMVKLQQGQVVKTEWNGKWWVARVEEVDCSLVKMHFDADSRTEWIYRGSTRLGPLFMELSHARRAQASSIFGRHRGPGVASLKKRNMPYVEYTRNDADDNKSEEVSKETGDDGAKVAQAHTSRAVARKSTARPPEPFPIETEIVERKSNQEPQFGTVEYMQLATQYRPKRFRPHQCSPSCISGVPYNPESMKGYNPLVIPMLCGWNRELSRARGRRCVVYRSPCGRRIRSMEELHRYLRSVASTMGVDLFDFDFWVHCFAEFVLAKGFSEIKDLSYGMENVPVSCVNCVDHSVPDFVNYSTQRLPMEGVPLNLDPAFLTGCDCKDDCKDRNKCSCWQLTVQGTSYGPTGEINPNVGYVFKRLPEAVPTGIYECNARCKCSSTCLNRVAQHPLQLKLQVFKTVKRGWGIRCLNDIPQGAFICVYAGRLLTEQGANEGGKNFGDEYLAELDYIEVVEGMKEGYESDVPEDELEIRVDSPAAVKKSTKAKRTDKASNDTKETEEGSSSSEEEVEPIDAHDSDEDFRPASTKRRGEKLADDGSIRTRLRNRQSRQSSLDSNQEKSHEAADTSNSVKHKTSQQVSKSTEKNTEDECIVLSDEDDVDVVRLPSSFTADVSVNSKEQKQTLKSIRDLYGRNEYCYIMDAKNAGNIGRYLNHSCSPNVFVQNVFVDTHDLRFPWVAFFALTYIRSGTELTWDYNYDVGSVPGKVLHCYCGAEDCRGRLL